TRPAFQPATDAPPAAAGSAHTETVSPSCHPRNSHPDWISSCFLFFANGRELVSLALFPGCQPGHCQFRSRILALFTHYHDRRFPCVSIKEKKYYPRHTSRLASTRR